MRKVIGIDPGVGGGMAVVDVDSKDVVDVTAMPGTLRDISDFVEKHKDAIGAYIEVVHSMPKQGVASTFTFGQFYGYVQMAVAAHKIRCKDVLPSKWQKALGVQSKKNEAYTKHKSRLKGMAQQLFPKAKVTLKNADALLIAEYGRQIEAQ